MAFDKYWEDRDLLRTVYVPAKDDAELRQIAKETGASVSRLIVQALEVSVAARNHSRF
jgi:hypothetical protein